uniref:Uncharacterized protein n=1 Tax=Siphoviridae sp. ctGO42 TaxID=2827566 RepID=A0A8S5LIZ7_9CAUD|nr:MAG TPA: hypothetical protein [Siphoviridae sp. ctGO42]
MSWLGCIRLSFVRSPGSPWQASVMSAASMRTCSEGDSIFGSSSAPLFIFLSSLSSQSTLARRCFSDAVRPTAAGRGGAHCLPGRSLGSGVSPSSSRTRFSLSLAGFRACLLAGRR